MPRRGLNMPRRCETFHGGGYIFHRGMEYSRDVLKCSTQVSNIPRRYQIFDGGG